MFRRNNNTAQNNVKAENKASIAPSRPLNKNMSQNVNQTKGNNMNSKNADNQQQAANKPNMSAASAVASIANNPAAVQQKPVASSPVGAVNNPAMSTPNPANFSTPDMSHSISNTQQKQEMKKLVIGEDITISGDINSCDYLIVEGSVKSDFKGSNQLDIAENGEFSGSAETNEADIAGSFDGTLIVNGRLTIRSSGHVKGTIQYKELAVEAGAIIEGKLKTESENANTTKSKKSSKKQDDNQMELVAG